MPAEAAVAGAARLAAQHRVFERPLGVAGIWGAVIRAWLDELLPPDALEHCRGRVQLVVTQVPELCCLRGLCSRKFYADSQLKEPQLLRSVGSFLHVTSSY